MPKREDENWVSWRESDLRYCPGCKKFVSASDFRKYHYGKCFRADSLPSQQQAPQLYRCPRCGRDSLFRHPESGMYECLNRGCQAIFASTYDVQKEIQRMEGVKCPRCRSSDIYYMRYRNAWYCPRCTLITENLAPKLEPVEVNWQREYEKRHREELATARAYSKRRKLPLGSVVALLIVIALIGAVVCAFAGVAPFSTAKDTVISWFSTSQGSPGGGAPAGTTAQTPTPTPTPPADEGRKYIGGLYNNPNAVDPTWSQLKDFLWSDTTDQHYYQYPLFVCDHFAKMLHNNAEKAGIRAAYVTVDLLGYSDPYNLGIPANTSHALNAFRTTDRGLLYIDDTGLRKQDHFSCSADKYVIVEVGKKYTPISVFPCGYYDYSWGDMGTVTDVRIQW